MQKKAEAKRILIMAAFLIPILVWFGVFDNTYAFIPSSVALPNPAGFKSFPELLCLLARFIFMLSVPIVILMFLYGGFLFLTSAGSPERIRSAKNVLVYAVVGIIIAIAAQGIVLVVSSFILKSGGANVCSAGAPAPTSCSVASDCYSGGTPLCTTDNTGRIIYSCIAGSCQQTGTQDCGPDRDYCSTDQWRSQTFFCTSGTGACSSVDSLEQNCALSGKTCLQICNGVSCASCIAQPLSASCSVSPSTIDIGRSATWSSMVVGGETPYTYSWSGTDGLSGVGSAVSKTYLTSGTKIASLIVNSADGQNKVVSCSNSLTVNAPPPLVVSCSVNPTTILIDGSATWSSAVSGGSGSYTYSWSGTDGLSGTTASVTKVYTTSGTKSASVAVSSLGVTSQVASCLNSLTVNTPPPPPPVCGNGVLETGESCDNGGLNGVCPAVCSSSCAINTCLPPPPPFDYTLSNGGNKNVFQGSSVSNTITITLVSGTPQNVSLSVSGLPIGASYALSPVGGCSPDPATCTVSLTISTQPTTPVGNYLITVTGSPLGKTTAFTLSVRAALLTANSCIPFPNPALTGQTVTWTVTPSGGTPPYTYTWRGDDGLTGMTQSVTHIYTKASAPLYNAFVSIKSSDGQTITDFGCQSLTVNFANSNPVAVALISKDGVSFSNSVNVVRGQPVSLWLAVTGSVDPDGWTANPGGVAIGGKCEWNSDLNQGAPTFETTINNPASSAACAIPLGSMIFNDAFGTYTYNVLRITDNTGGSSNIATVQVQVVCSAGLGAYSSEYYDNYSLSSPYVVGNLIESACESGPNISYAGSPVNNWPASLPPSIYSGIWTGNFNFTAGNYQLIAGSDDGIHVYLNGTLLTNPSSWVPRAYIAEGINFTITPAEATTPQQITVEYFQHAGGRVINVSWTKL